MFCFLFNMFYLLYVVFLGAIDGSHVRIDKPVEDADSHINRKQYFSIHVQGTANHKLKFMDVFIGYPGSVHDAKVLKNSTIYNDLHELCGGKLKIEYYKMKSCKLNIKIYFKCYEYFSR